MLTLADLDGPEGLVRFREACAARHACIPALRYFTEGVAAGMPLRQALVEMAGVNEEAPGWALWAWECLQGLIDDDFSLHLLKLGLGADADPGQAAYLDLHGPGTEADKAWLRTLWHSGHRPDGQVVLPEWEKAVD